LLFLLLFLLVLSLSYFFEFRPQCHNFFP
jgi:hypothetical protein